MGGLLEFILANPFFILLILGGFFSLFRGNEKSTQQKRTQPSNQPRPTPQRAQRVEPQRAQRVEPNHPKQSQQAMRQSEAKQINTSVRERQSVSDRQLQMNRHVEATRLQQRSEYSHHRSKNVSQQTRKNAVSKQPQLEIASPMMARRIKRKLTRQGLIDSIVMAEILGPPRARKRYRNLVSERRRLS